ncbi:hypothetical protein HQ529_00860 [Candidatus Woesearchaeota archaeon]|nr:hypothetical protein [Candidatus Woesearchaeota archaeon]
MPEDNDDNDDIETDEFVVPTLDAYGPCFVASVIYGDPNAPEVNVLREYKNKVLGKSYLGNKFIDFYYSGAGQKAAEFIRTNLADLIPTMKRGLDHLVQKYQKNLKKN